MNKKRVMSKLIALAIKKNKDSFSKWIENTPKKVLSIEKIREITSKIDYSMVEDSLR
jgi:hypothetical protein